jgi:hypothetical protein
MDKSTVVILRIAKSANSSLNFSYNSGVATPTGTPPLVKGEFYRSIQAILRIFVAPGVPNGTPAVITTRWPISPIFSR